MAVIGGRAPVQLDFHLLDLFFDSQQLGLDGVHEPGHLLLLGINLIEEFVDGFVEGLNPLIFLEEVILLGSCVFLDRLAIGNLLTDG